jgi:regulatory protein
VGGRITAIEESGDGEGRVTVYVDGRQAFTVSSGVARTLGLAVGQGGEIVEVLATDDGPELARARQAALRLLAVRARSRVELLDRLKRKGIGVRAASEAVGALEAVGLVNDADFARLWAEERVRLRPVGARRLERELLSKGVPGSVAAEIIGETYRAHPEIELARRVLAKRVSKSGVRDPKKERTRAYTFLLRRGFSHEVVLRALTEHERESGE